MKLRTLEVILGIAFVLGVAVAPAFANGVDVPEIGAGNLASAVTLVTGGYLLLRSKFRR